MTAAFAVEIRKFDENRQTDRQRIQLQRPLLSSVDRRGERAITEKNTRHDTMKTKITNMQTKTRQFIGMTFL